MATIPLPWKLFSVASLILLVLSCSNNSTGPAQTPPRVDSVTVAPDFILPGGTLHLSAYATDPDNDDLRYQWITYPRVGRFINDTLPQTDFIFAEFLRSGMSVQFRLTVYDGADSAIFDRWVVIDTGISVVGHIYFRNTEIPLSGALVKVNGREDTSDVDGVYALYDLYAGPYELTAAIDGCDSYSESLDLTINRNLEIYFTCPAHTGTIQGYARTKEGAPLDQVRLTLLNPDGTNSNISTLSGTDGFYQLSGVPNGTRRLLIEDGGNVDYDILTEVQDVILFGGILDNDIIVKVRRLAFVSDGAQSADLWETEASGPFEPWSIDIENDCLRYDFCTANDFGRLAMLNAVAIPAQAAAVYWVFDIELEEAACEVLVYINGVQSTGGIFWSGNKHYLINEPVRVPADQYLAGANVLIEIYAWPQRTGTCGNVRLNYFRLDYLE